MAFYAALAAGVVAVVALIGHRMHALGRVAAVALGLTAGLWLVGVAVAATGWQDIDGWIDCHPNCNAWHNVGAVWFWLPLVVALGLLGILAWAFVVRGSGRGDESRT
jgi:hypothetical protein